MNMRVVKPSSDPEKQTRTTVDTIELTPKLVASWKSPPFQREVKINAKVTAAADDILRDGGVLPGILTLGYFDSETYLVDGQHRIAAFLQTGLSHGYADVRTHFFKTLAEMSEEFVKLNSALVRFRPDDMLRGYEASNKHLQQIRRKCGFIGYDMVRRNEKSPVLSMSVFLRMWMGSRGEIPQPMNSINALNALTEDETKNAIEFVSLCYDAWQRDSEYARLWGALNLLVCAWLYRRVVLGEHVGSASRLKRMSKDEFRQGLLALSTEDHYIDYLLGRKPNDRDRSPAYNRVKKIFQRRYHVNTGNKLLLPQPNWAHQ